MTMRGTISGDRITASAAVLPRKRFHAIAKAAIVPRTSATIPDANPITSEFQAALVHSDEAKTASYQRSEKPLGLA